MEDQTSPNSIAGREAQRLGAMSSITVGAAPASAAHNVFVYGSLLADEVVRVLLHRVPPSSSAVLHGFHRFSIKGRVYPAILPVESKSVMGKVLHGITDFELDVLDMFEDEEYKRSTVEVSLIDTSEKLLADTYVWENQEDPNLHGDWNFEEWKRLHMKDFIAMTAGFMEEQKHSGSRTRSILERYNLQLLKNLKFHDPDLLEVNLMKIGRYKIWDEPVP